MATTKTKPPPKTLVTILTEDLPLVPLANLVEHPQNPRIGDVDEIVSSIRTNGFFGSLLVQRGTNYVLAGNHTLKAARKLRMPMVPVTWLNCSEERAQKILLADNRIPQGGGYDDKQLLALLQQFEHTAEGLERTGYNADDLLKLLEEYGQPEMEGDEGEEATTHLGTGEGAQVLPGSQVVQVQLFYTVSTIDEFLLQVEYLKGRWELGNVTDVVTRALRESYEFESGDDEPEESE